MRYGLKLFLIALVTLSIGLIVLSLALFERKGKWAYSVSRLWTRAILKIGGVSLKVQGLDRLDPSRQYIFMANHQSNIDIPVLVESLKEFQLRWVAKKELLYVPLFGWALRTSKHIIVDRADRSQAVAALKRAKETMDEGISVVLFPEGTRSPSGKLLLFKRGGFVLAVRTRTPVVPVTINGSGAILPKGDWRIRKGEIEVIVSDPIPVERHHLGKLGDLIAQVRGIMESHCGSHAAPLNDSSKDREAAAVAQG